MCSGDTGGRILLRGKSLKPTRSRLPAGTLGRDIGFGSVESGISTKSVFLVILMGCGGSVGFIGCHGWLSSSGGLVNKFTSSFGRVGSVGVTSPVVTKLFVFVTGMRAVVVDGSVCNGMEMVGYVMGCGVVVVLDELLLNAELAVVLGNVDVVDVVDIAVVVCIVDVLLLVLMCVVVTGGVAVVVVSTDFVGAIEISIIVAGVVLTSSAEL